jgi:uncharacterized protein
MDPGVRDELLLRLFRQLRADGLCLGIAELLAARQALAAGLGGDGETALRRLLRLLWCTSQAQNDELDDLLHRLLLELEEPGAHAPEPLPPCDPPPAPGQPQERPQPEMLDAPPVPIPRPAPAIMPQPVRSPELPAPAGSDPGLALYTPVSRRAMAYSWRYLRRPVKDGPCDRLDLDATVERAARLGYLDRPVLGRRITDHGHLLVLVDQGGSMVPFHRLTRDLVQTAEESVLSHAGRRVDIAYFHNVPPKQVYLDAHRTRLVALDELLQGCTHESGVLVVSDAGAARGGRSSQRFAATARILVQIKQRGGGLAWLNPVPEDRWPGSTAALIRAIVPMFAMNEDGFGNAVDILRGQAVGART